MFNFDKFKEIRDFLEKSKKKCEIVAISKNHPKETVIEALNYGVRVFGENRVMEAKLKFLDLKDKYPKTELHLTGPLQSNKVKEAVRLFDVFHTLDREKIAKEFSKYKDQLKSKKIFVQVNTGGEETKSGIAPKELNEFIFFCQNEIEIKISGLMCIPPIYEKPEKHFSMLDKLAKENRLNELSIGMSGDFENALNYNPTYIRLGTILFGER